MRCQHVDRGGQCYVWFSPAMNEFHLNAHSVSQATAKTPKYSHSLVHCDSHIPMNAVAGITYGLCSLHDIVTATMSIPVPLIAADHCAKRDHNVYIDNSNQRDAVDSIEEANKRLANPLAVFFFKFFINCVHLLPKVEYLRAEVNRISCVYPTPQFRFVPPKARVSIANSVRKCCADIDKNFEVSQESVRRFYIDCYAKYHATMGWNDYDKRKSRKASQEAVSTNSDSNEVPLAEGLKRGPKRPGSHLDEENMTKSCKVKKSESEEADACSESSATSTCGPSTSRGDAPATSSQDDVVVLSEDTNTNNKRLEFSMLSEPNDEKDVASLLLSKYNLTTTCTKEPSTSNLVQAETCTLCGASGSAINFQTASNLVDFGRAVAFYKRAQCVHAMVCKRHYIKAISTQGTDVRRPCSEDWAR
ncbi:hypothetical protein ANCCAN_15991 [Ancylostoma caninum]|uniref:Piwi domain-containing protein n=1 Tax=Ancylostoma caninum TaxID=29170 RepID=A0A368G347_ANCCA|nr:hypothetical protein ANCCAN_15991 [Ancylostoma caninum]